MFSLFLVLPILALAQPQMFETAPEERVAVVSAGPNDGKTVVLLPGLSGCSYGFRSLSLLLHAEGLATVAIEPLGIGLSDRPRDADYTLDTQARRIAQVLDEIGITRAVFVSQGVATGMSLRLALDRPGLVTGIVSIEGGAADAAATPTVLKNLRLAGLIARMGGARYLRDRYAEDLKAASGDPSWVDKMTVRYYFRGPGRDVPATLDVFRAMAQQSEPRLLRPRLAQVAAPMILLRGEAGHECALADAEVAVLETELPRCEVRGIAGAGHFIHEEQPEAVAGAVLDLLRPVLADDP